MQLNIDPEWLLRMVELEDNGIISVGGLVRRLSKMELAEGQEAGDQGEGDSDRPLNEPRPDCGSAPEEAEG